MSNKEKAFIYISLFFFIPHFVSGQNQKLADSLINAYKSELYPTYELDLIYNIANELTNPERKLEYSELLIEKASADSLFYFLHNGYLQKGNALQEMGNNVLALDSYFESLTFAHRIKDVEGIGAVTISIADTYSEIGNSENAKLYYDKGISLLRNTTDSIKLATALLNAGDEVFKTGDYDSAIQYFNESSIIFKKVNYLVGTAYNLGNIGMVYAEQGMDVLAETNINEAIAILEELQDYYPISVYLTYISDIYLKKGAEKTALAYARRSLELAEQYGLKDQVSEANLKLSELYEKSGDSVKSYKYYKNHIIYRDSVRNIESVQQMADLRTNYEVSQKQIEVDLLNQQKKNQQIIVVASIVSFFLISLLAFGLYHRSIFIQRTSNIIEAEKDRSEALLLNILPAETAQELKEHGKIQAKKFDLVTVLFTDFKGFTKLAEHTEPEQLVKSIDFYFKAFDEITTKFRLEKIKTIGDSYMCAGGLPTVTKTHACDVIRAAREMVELVGNELKLPDDLIHFEIRIGIHTGPVIAGIVGIKKWQYDIWGDTVNIASRMESSSEVGRINISESTYQEIKDEFPCEYRGEIEVKNRGHLKMYFLS